jgi:hypothetical protein
MSNVINQELRPGHCMCTACICCFDACDCEDFVCCCSGACDCLCLRYGGCLAVGYHCLGFGVVTNESRNEICKVAIGCCELGIVTPSTLCSCANQTLCYQYVAAIPFHPDYVNVPVCACYGIQCLPACGCCGAPPVAPIFKILRNSRENGEDNAVMERE